MLFKNTGFKEIHCSVSKVESVINAPKTPMNSMTFFDERIISFSDPEKISKIKMVINQ